MSIGKYVTRFTGIAIVLLAREAAAEEKTGETTVLGKRGTVVLDRLVGVSFGSATPGLAGGALGGVLQAGFLDFSHSASSAGGASLTSTSVAVRPSLDVFVTPRVTLGGELGFGYQWMTEPLYDPRAEGSGDVRSQYYQLSAMGRIGYYLPLSESIAFWPRLAAGGTYQRDTRGREVSDIPPSEVARVAFRATADLDLAVPITKHLFLLAGPRVSATLASNVGDTVTFTAVTASFRGGLSYAF